MAKKPIRWAVQEGCEDYYGMAAFYRDHEENMRNAFSQPYRSARRIFANGHSWGYIISVNRELYNNNACSQIKP